MLAHEMKKHLTEKIIPFWSALKDDEHGGYYGYMDYDLKLNKKAIKGCILNSRILWFFSNAYKLLGDKELLINAEHAYRFLIDYCIDKENGGIFWSLEFSGEPKDDTKHTYNQAFAIYALASYYDISKDEKALNAAFELYHIIEDRCRDSSGYMEAFDRRFIPVTNDKLSENGIIAEKTMNTILHVMESYTELYRVSKNSEVADKLLWIMDTIDSKIFNPLKKRQEVFFDKDFKSLIDLHSYGHDIEASWLIDLACDVLDNQKLRERMSHITRILTEKIYERAYRDHSLLNECVHGKDDEKRIWWVQAEAVVGFYNGYEKDKEKKEYLAAAEDIWYYIKENIVDKREGGEWFWCVDKNNVPASDRPIVEPWKCPYHNGRMCIEIIKRSEFLTK